MDKTFIRAFTIRESQIRELMELSQKLGLSKSEIIRRAVDEFYRKELLRENYSSRGPIGRGN